MKVLLPDLDDLLELRHQAHTLGLASRHPVNSLLCGLYQSVFRGQGMNFDEVREYQEGDEIRNMDWRVTARTNVPHLKVFKEERQRSVLLCVDIGSHMQFGTRNTFKLVQAARISALLGWAASASQDRVGALLFGDPNGLRYFPPSSSRRSLWQMLRSMTEAAPKQKNSSHYLADAMEKLIHGTAIGSLILIISDFSQDLVNFEQILGRLQQKHEVVLFPVDDKADYEIPAMGRVVFATGTGIELELDTDNRAGCAQYRQQWQQQRQRLEMIAKRLGADVIPVSTEQNVHQVLLQGLRKRAYRVGR